MTVGLAIGLLIVAKVFVEQSFDHFIPEYENVYIVSERIVTNSEFKEYNQTPGAIAPGIKLYAPQVESATRLTGAAGPLAIRTPDGRLIDAEGVKLADSCLFEVLRHPVISGNPKDIFAVENHCMIPRSLAEKIGGDVIGITLSSPDISDKYIITVDGVYEDFPVNSSFSNAI